MNNYFKIIGLYIAFGILQILLSFILIFSYSLDFQGSIDLIALWSLWRLLFFSLPFIVLSLVFIKLLRKVFKRSYLVFSFNNLFVYVSLSYLTKLIWGENIPLPPHGTMFWFTCISIFVSPIISNQIMALRQIMNRFIHFSENESYPT